MLVTDRARWIARRGYLTMPEYGYALARYVRCRGEDGSQLAKELRLDVRSPFQKALRFLAVEAESAESE